MPNTLVDVLVEHAVTRGPQVACTFLADGEAAESHLTFAELDERARATAAVLDSHGLRGERVLLLYPPCLDYVTAFLGCLYAGAVAVPAYPPRPNRGLARIEAIVDDAQAAAALTSASIREQLQPLLGQAVALRALRWLDTGHSAPAAWKPPALASDELAFLQYTSGSTATPKGVMVSHGNLLHNEQVIAAALAHYSGTVFVSWLPLYHDMGLIGSLLQPLYVGARAVLMSPAAFLQRPVRWLQAISRYRSETSGAPNFAYDLCVRKITPQERVGLDLSSWSVAFNGAEPVRAETLERFAETFASCGLRREALYPCYGLAEATLLVTGRTRPDTGLLVGQAEIDSELPSARPRQVVSCGTPRLGQIVLAVDPDTHRPVPPGTPGEIWVSGPSVAQGYWRRPDDTAATFGATLAGGDGRRYLRTGDLGFVRDGELYVTGRMKDLLIVAGANVHPEDLELTASRSHEALVPGGGAAFGVDVDGRERVVLVHEVGRRFLRELDAEGVAQAIRAALAREHELSVDAVVLVMPGGVPRTSSGKVRRRACREQYLARRLPLCAPPSLTPDEPHNSDEPAARPAPHAARGEARRIEGWLVGRLARRRHVPETGIDPELPFVAHGLSSVDAVGLAGELEAWLGRPIAATAAWDHPTPRALARHLAGEDTPTPGGPTPWARPTSEPIAVIGLGCRFPGAESPDEFWALLAGGRSGVRPLPVQRRAPGDHDGGAGEPPCGGFLDQVERFDADFFGVTPREAAQLDPQQRLLLETAWEALEHAGQPPHALAGTRTGVFVGLSTHDYAHLALDPRRAPDAFAGTGNAASIAANRLSYFLDLRGPSLCIDTACSSSLVAVHQACQSLRLGECDLALAGGVNVILTPELTAVFARAGMLSPSGRCRTFDQAADGYVRGEGCGVVVLKPLSRALREGDRVLAVIRGSALAQDGRTNGLTAPSGRAQQAAVRAALAQAGVDPREIGYVETHGTGTPLGDPIEIEALKAVLLERRDPAQPCVLGAVKTHVGHLEAAAGIAGLIKTVLVLMHERIPANLGFEQVNPRIALTGTPLVLPVEPRPWPRAGGRRLAGVSSFGFGGTNCHVILEEGPGERDGAASAGRAAELLLLSAASPTALRELARRHAAFAATAGAGSLSAACATSRAGRSHLPRRLALCARSWSDVHAALAAFAEGRLVPGVRARLDAPLPEPQLAFVYADETGCRDGVARELIDEQPVFRQALEECAAAWPPVEPALRALVSPTGTVSGPVPVEHAPARSFAVQYALTRLWQACGLRPEAVVGYGAGEYAAACAAGRLSLADGLRLALERGRVCAELPIVPRCLVRAAPERVRAVVEGCAGGVEIAAVDGPQHVVLTGPANELAAAMERFAAQGVRVRPLSPAAALVSAAGRAAAEAFAAWMGDGAPAREVELVSSVSGTRAEAAELAGGAYWRRQLPAPVAFAPAVETLRAAGVTVFVELGPRARLTALGRRGWPGELWLASLGSRGRSQHRPGLGALYVRGAALDWAALGPRRPKLALPTYPFQRERHWLPAPSAHPAPRDGSGAHPLLGPRLAPPAHVAQLHAWELELGSGWQALVDGHRVRGTAVLPLAVYLELARAAAQQAFGTGRHSVADLRLERPLPLRAQPVPRLQVSLLPEADGTAAFSVHSRVERGSTADAHVERGWTLHATARIHRWVPAGEARHVEGA